MDAALEVARLVLRQESSAPETLPDEAITCEGSNSYDGRMGVRISAIFVIFIGSLFGKSSDTTSSPACTNNP
jgi:zinc transporter 1/2/3